MISFAFYQKMSSILAEGQFNLNEYSPQELQILVESLPMIKSDYCNEDFRQGFLSYLNSEGQEANLELAKKFELKSVGKEAPKNNKWLDFLLESNTIEETIEKLDKFPKQNYTNAEGNEELYLVFGMEMREMEGPGTISRPYSMVLNEVKSFFDDKEYSVWVYNQASYYSQFLCTQDYFNHMSILDFFKTVASYARSKDSFDKLISKAKVTNLTHIFDDNIKDGWGTQESQEELSETIIKARFWQDLIDRKAWQAVELIIKALQEPEKLAGAIRSLTSWMDDMSGDRESGAYVSESKLSELLDKVKITPENAEHVFNVLSKALKVDANYRDVDLTKADEIGFNVSKLKELAAKYQMPSVILTKLLQEEFPKFRIGQNNSSKNTDSNETKILSSSANQDSLTINSNDSLDSSENNSISEEREDSQASSSSHNISVDNLNNFSDIETSLDATDYTSPNVANNMAKTLKPAFKMLSEERLMNEYKKVNFATFTKKVDHSKVKQLAAEYQITSELLGQAIIKAKFVKDEATTLNILEKKFAKIQSDTKTDNSLEFTIDGYNVALMPKSDPTALFVGKMTASCQHYMGHSSKQAVIPVYTDPNAGLIVVTTKQTKTVKGACFAWLSEDGLVLDSFEAPGKDCDDAFLPFVTQLARGLKDSGLKLYVGSGGHTPELLLKGSPVHPQSAPNPLTDDFKPYGDSSQVYLIDPDINIHPESGYKINSKAGEQIEYKTIADFIEIIEDKALAKVIIEQKNLVKCINNLLLQSYGQNPNEVIAELFNKLNSDINNNSNTLNNLINFANLIEKLRELDGSSYCSLADFDSIFNLNTIKTQNINHQHTNFPTIEKLEEKVKLLESFSIVKLKIKEDFSVEPEIAAKIVKVLERNCEHVISSQKDLDEFASNCTFENLNIIRGYFELADALQNLNYDSYNPTTFDILSVILMETKGEEEPYKNESYRLTLEQLKSRLDFAKKAKKIKQELLPQYQNAFEEFAKNLPHGSIKPATIKTLQDLLKKPVSPEDLNAIPEILSKLSIDANNIHIIEEYLEITQILTKANKHYAQNKLEEISQILRNTEPKPFEFSPMKQTLKKLQSMLDAVNNKDKLPEFSKELEERLKSLPEGSVKPETIEKLKAGIDKASWDEEFNAIPLVISSLTEENIGMIEEYLELAERLEGSNNTSYSNNPFYCIGKLLGKVELYPNEILNLDSLKSQLKTEIEKQKFPEHKAQLESILQTFPENSIKPETIEKLKTGIDKASWSEEINAISIVMSSLTKENILEIEEFIEIASKLKESNQSYYYDVPFYYIRRILDNSPANQGEYKWTLDFLRYNLSNYESEAAKNLSASAAIASASANELEQEGPNINLAGGHNQDEL